VAVSLVPIPFAEQDRASCPSCSAPLAPDQRYCLSCGQPVSPVRLAFLDVLQPEPQPYAGGYGQGQLGPLPPGYAPVIEPSSTASGWMRRYSGLFGLLSVLLMTIIVGLLVGHWITQSKAPSAQVLTVKGLTIPASAAAAAGTTPASTTPASATPQPAASNTPSAKTEASEAKEAKAIEKAPTPKAVKVTPAKLQKLDTTSGKKHEEEINALGSQPIETG
jgi:hypothetical protein